MPDNKPVAVDTGKLLTSAGTVYDAAGHVENVVANLKNRLNAKGYPWGYDNYGNKFTGGDSGYTKSSKNLLDGADNLHTSLNQFGDGLRDTANKMDNMDK
jgi:hypothetical protein